ncbi:MAG: threonine synthase [Selenomonadaceae bacterium]|nr:threonine synthase [Selenomonadaceae bacterium]
MRYISTRGNAEELTAAEAIINGLAADGGLYVPTAIPQVTPEFLTSLTTLSYEERAAKILALFLTDYTAGELRNCLTRAYGDDKFDDPRCAPVECLTDTNILELWHGPTSAFKDMALQLLPQLLGTALRKKGEERTVLILVATSGDTGKAAMAGFADVPGTKIMVFYPHGGVSPVQEKQMLTQKGANVNVTAVRGNFDDAQNGVKEIFNDAAFSEELLRQDVKLSSANSINWGRLAPQIVYYFSAYADLLKAGKIQLGAEINFSVPTGNFGDILAAYYAKLMGLPIHKLICASNANNVLTDFLRTGLYDRKRPFFKTITPSMDILISSNLERLLYHITENAAQVKAWMEELRQTGRYQVDEGTLAKIQALFWADWTDDEGTKDMIRLAFARENYVPDTHTAVAWRVAENYRKETGDSRPMVVVSTASPYKFAPHVLAALGENDLPEDEAVMFDRLHKKSKLTIPRGLAALRNAPLLHNNLCQREEMAARVLAFAKK